jgi:RNA polymerase sigma-70 factor, ECF subfamily
MSTANVASVSMPSFAELVENVRLERPEGLDQLYVVFRMISGSLRRQIGFVDFEDRLHDIYLLVVDAIRGGKLREPAALTSYIHGIARLATCSHIGVRARHRRLSGTFQQWLDIRTVKATPEAQLQEKQRMQIMRELLSSLSERERQVLSRFYLHEQTKEEICLAMNLTTTQFRLAKSRAKQRLGRMGAAHMNPHEQAA